MSDPFFTTYNRTDDSHLVQDILTSIVYLESRPEVARVNLAGVGEGGAVVSAGPGLCSGAPPHPGGMCLVSRAKRTRPIWSISTFRC